MMLLSTLLTTFSIAFATDYYFATGGSDQDPGTLQRPWATTQIFWKTCFQPGDRILFQGGATFKGRIYFNLSCSVSGSLVSPIVLTSYGTGRAVIEGGFEAHDKGDIELRNLNFRNTAAGNTEDRIAFYGTDHSNTTRSYLRIDQVEVSNFGAFGIVVGPWWDDTGGYSDVRIMYAISNGNRKGGIVMYATATGKLYVNKNVYLSDSEAFNSTGYKDINCPPGWKLEGTGNGILLGSVDGAVIEWRKACTTTAQIMITPMAQSALWCTVRRAGIDKITQMRIMGHKTDAMDIRYGVVEDQDIVEGRRKAGRSVSRRSS